MVINEKISRQTAQYLLQINAIKLNPENPFNWASGWMSPIYCDNRIALSFPLVRSYLCTTMAEEIKKFKFQNFIIAGVATGAIGIGMLVANYLKVPFIYVRPEIKKHGRKNQIEGLLENKQKVIVIEDLISTGKSSLNAVKSLREHGAEILTMLALFNYGFEIAEKNFKKEAVKLTTLCDYNHLLALALEQKLISEKHLESLKYWRKNPEKWSSN